MKLRHTKSRGWITVSEDDLRNLVTLAKASGDMIVLAESQNGGLVSVDMLKKANELRLELSRWKDVVK